jgi:hypothetical protein
VVLANIGQRYLLMTACLTPNSMPRWRSQKERELTSMTIQVLQSCASRPAALLLLLLPLLLLLRLLRLLRRRASGGSWAAAVLAAAPAGPASALRCASLKVEMLNVVTCRTHMPPHPMMVVTCEATVQAP